MEIFGEKGFRVLVCFWPEIDIAKMEFISEISSLIIQGKLKRNDYQKVSFLC